jgi:uncharacterized protein YneF (UPF0154 family)
MSADATHIVWGALLLVVGVLIGAVWTSIRWGRERRKVNVPVKKERWKL